MKNKFLAAVAVATTLVMTAAVAGAAPADPLEGAIDTTQDQIIGYAAPIGAALVAVGLAYVAVKLIPKVIKMVGARLG